MKVYAFDSIEWDETEKNGVSKLAAIDAVERGLAAVRPLLPTLSAHLNVVVRPHFLHLIPEYGTGAYTYDSEFIEITIDKTVPYGPENMLDSLYETPFHEGNHAARYNAVEFDPSFSHYAIMEGLATVFERDHAGFEAPWGKHEDDATMCNWFKEIQAADWDKKQELFFDHPDGRRWVGYKAGTWLIDRAVKRSGKTVIDLTTLPADEIIRYAAVTEG